MAHIECNFRPRLVSEKVTGTKNLQKDIKLPERVYCFDNNFTSSFALMCSQWRLVAGESFSIQTYHPSTMQTIALKITPHEIETVEADGASFEAFRCEISPINNQFWITTGGQLVRAEQGDLLIELESTHVPPQD